MRSGGRMGAVQGADETVQSQHAFGDLRFTAREGKAHMVACALTEVLAGHDSDMRLGEKRIRERLRGIDARPRGRHAADP